MRRLSLRAVACLVAVGFVLAISTVAHAQQNKTTTTPAPGNGFRISPVRAEYTIDKGDGKTIAITLENPSNASTVARGVVNDFVASDKEDGEPRLILDENAKAPRNSFKNLVQPIGDITLAPREKKEVPVTIRVPSDAHSGGYYGAIRFVTVNNNIANNNVGLNASVGTIVLVTVPGNLTQKLTLVQFGSADSKGKFKSFFTSGPVHVVARVKNVGDIHVKPFGKIIITGFSGKVIESYEINNKAPRDNVLPDSVRRFENTLNHKKWLGRYTISANIGYVEGSGDIISAKSTFWYLPPFALAVILIVVAALVVGAVFAVSRLRGQRHHKHHK